MSTRSRGSCVRCVRFTVDTACAVLKGASTPVKAARESNASPAAWFLSTPTLASIATRVNDTIAAKADAPFGMPASARYCTNPLLERKAS